MPAPTASLLVALTLLTPVTAVAAGAADDPPATASAAPEETPAAASWLDQAAVERWNRAEAGVPKAPAVEANLAYRERCRDQLRPPSSPADEALVAAGWTLFGPLQIFAETSLVHALADLDGMCRPLQFQVFVFTGDAFAGTLSPQPMDSRSDGAVQQVVLTNAGVVNAVFSRYQPEDALCCPSRTTRVSYQVKPVDGGAVVIPVSVATDPAN